MALLYFQPHAYLAGAAPSCPDGMGGGIHALDFGCSLLGRFLLSTVFTVFALFFKINFRGVTSRATAFEISRKGYQEGAEDSKRRQSAFSGY